MNDELSEILYGDSDTDTNARDFRQRDGYADPIGIGTARELLNRGFLRVPPGWGGHEDVFLNELESLANTTTLELRLGGGAATDDTIYIDSAYLIGDGDLDRDTLKTALRHINAFRHADISYKRFDGDEAIYFWWD